MAAIVDFDERTLAFKAVAAAFCHARIIAMGRRLWSARPTRKSEVSRCCDGKHAEQRCQHSNEIANVLHFPLPVEGASR